MFTINTDEKREEKDTPNSNTQQWLLILMYIYIFFEPFFLCTYIVPQQNCDHSMYFFVIKTN